jgi:hypothetical protein
MLSTPASRIVPEPDHSVFVDLTAARRFLCEVALMAGRAAVAADPREVWLAVGVLAYRRQQ